MTRKRREFGARQAFDSVKQEYTCIDNIAVVVLTLFLENLHPECENTALGRQLWILDAADKIGIH